MNVSKARYTICRPVINIGELMNIIFATSNDLSKYSADIVYIMEMCNAFSKAGFNTTLCVPQTHLDTEMLFAYYGVEYPFEVLEINLPEIFLGGAICGRGAVFSLLAARRLNKIDNTIIILRDPWLFFIGTVIFKQQCFLDSHKYRCELPLQTLIYRMLVKCGVNTRYGRVVCISSTLKKQWERQGIDCTKMVVAHDAVNVNKFNTSIPKSEARKRLGLEYDVPIVAYTGSLIPGKGVDVLVKCANRLPDISFIIVGGADDNIGQLRKHVENENVFFLGHIAPERIPIYQAAADVLALPNTRGSVIDDVTSPMKLFEYIASERPIVATDMPSVLEILQDNYNALISPAGDDGKLAENIKLLLQNPSLGKQLVNNARISLEKFTWDARVQCLKRIFTNE